MGWLKGEYALSEKMLLMYASRFGSSAGVAGAIGKSLAEYDAKVEVLSLDDVRDAGVDQVVASEVSSWRRGWR